MAFRKAIIYMSSILVISFDSLWLLVIAKELMLLNCGVEEDFWESLGLQGDPTSQS